MHINGKIWQKQIKKKYVNTDRQRGRCGQHVERPEGDYSSSDRDETARREDSDAYGLRLFVGIDS